MLYQKYRSQNFADIVGQDSVKKTLQNSIKTGRIAHAYVFSGPRGTGKTSLARIFAKAINCENGSKNGEPCNKCDVCRQITSGQSVDVIEIDAASHTGVDDIRLLIEKVEFAPTKFKKKVYIIDEVHMLSKSAFNAMLKTLEEPPNHVVFILATTEIHKIPVTILSRCQRFDFQLGTEDEIIVLLKNIAQKEKIDIEEEVFSLIAKLGQGSYRDSITVMDRVLSIRSLVGDKKIELNEVRKFLGIPDNEKYKLLLDQLFSCDVSSSLLTVDNIFSSGVSVKYFSSYFLEYLRSELISNITVNSDEKRAQVLFSIIKEFGEADRMISSSSVQRLPIEMAIIKVCGFSIAKVGSSSLGNKDIIINKKKMNDVKIEAKGKDNDNDNDKNPVLSASYRNTGKVLTADEICFGWHSFIEAVKPYNGHLFAFIAKSSIVKYENGILTLEVPYSFYKEQIENSKSQKSLMDASEKVYGSCFEIKCIIRDGKKKKIDGGGKFKTILDDAIDVFDEDIV